MECSKLTFNSMHSKTRSCISQCKIMWASTILSPCPTEQITEYQKDAEHREDFHHIWENMILGNASHIAC